jgi:Glutamate decarboxylase and related PLP-dependent proteins
MQPTLNNIEKNALNMPAEEFRALGHTLIDHLADFLKDLPARKITKGLTPSEIRKLIDADRSLPQVGTDAVNLLNKTSHLMTENSLFNGHPKFFGYITSSPSPLGALGDLIASVTNPNCGAFVLSPVATEIELQTIRWIGELIGYQKNCGGLLVSGGNMANIVGIWAARKAMATWNIRDKGLSQNGLKFKMYATTDVHTWLHKTSDLLGIGTDSIRWIPMDSQHRMVVSLLEEQIIKDKANGFFPMAVIGTAGSVGFGTIDPLAEIAAVCKKHSVWFHIDGAYGGLAAALPELQQSLDGLAEADSIAVDPHKWLFCPLEAGCTLVRDRKTLVDAFSFHPEYYLFDEIGNETPTNFYELGPQNSREFRALKVWMVLQQAGREGIIEMIRNNILLSKELFKELNKFSSLQTFTDHLSICTFRYVPEDMQGEAHEDYLNELNTELLSRMQKGGELFVSNAVLDGKYLLRSCIVNFRTTLKDITAIPEIVMKYGKETDDFLRQAQDKLMQKNK